MAMRSTKPERTIRPLNFGKRPIVFTLHPAWSRKFPLENFDDSGCIPTLYDLRTIMFIIKTLQGLEPVLAAELKDLGATDIQLLKRAVSCSGDQELLYRANYELRTALRVLVPIHSFSRKR